MLAGLGGTAQAQLAGQQTDYTSSPMARGGAQMSDAQAVQTTVDQANRLLQEKDPTRALETLDRGLKRSPRDPRLRFLYGVVLNQLGRGDEAVDVFQQLTEDYPELPEPYNNLAVLLAARGDLDQAKVALERAIRALPSYALAQENLGDLYLRMAARAYEQAGKLDARGDGKRKLELSRTMLTQIAGMAGAPVRRPAATSRPETPPSSAPFSPDSPSFGLPSTPASTNP
ncbi:MAG: tetratricopeptide repeat protein [Burkholderiaceae bacterium]